VLRVLSERIPAALDVLEPAIDETPPPDPSTPAAPARSAASAPSAAPAPVAELAQLKLGQGDLHDVLDRVAELARQTLPGAADASVTLVEPDRAYTVAFTGPLALDLDETQYENDYGPCLEVAQSSGTVAIPDMAAETRWPRFARKALADGVRSSLSVALPMQDAVLGALNIYATRPGAFDPGAVGLAQDFAGYAAVAIANARLYETTATLAENMRRAMETRAVIEQAKGILIAQQHCTPERAFELLTRLSQATHRKLRDCAADLVASTTESF
jgi:GAF domain-containing protein